MVHVLRSAVCMFYILLYVFVTVSVDQSSDQLSEDPGLTLLHVCAAVLSGVNVKTRPNIYSHTVISAGLLDVRVCV